MREDEYQDAMQDIKLRQVELEVCIIISSFVFPSWHSCSKTGC